MLRPDRPLRKKSTAKVRFQDESEIHDNRAYQDKILAATAANEAAEVSREKEEKKRKRSSKSSIAVAMADPIAMLEYEESKERQDRECLLMTSRDRYYHYNYSFKLESPDSTQICIVFTEVPGKNG